MLCPFAARRFMVNKCRNGQVRRSTYSSTYPSFSLGDICCS